MKRLITSSIIILLAVASLAFLFQSESEAHQPFAAPLPLIAGYIGQQSNCDNTQNGALVTFFDRTTGVKLCQMYTNESGYASCTAQPGHEIMITASYGGYTGCKIVIQSGSGTNFGVICIGDQCPD